MHHLLLLMLLMMSWCHHPLTVLVWVHVVSLLCLMGLLSPAMLMLLLPRLVGLEKMGAGVAWVSKICMQRR